MEKILRHKLGAENVKGIAKIYRPISSVLLSLQCKGVNGDEKVHLILTILSDTRLQLLLVVKARISSPTNE